MSSSAPTTQSAPPSAGYHVPPIDLELHSPSTLLTSPHLSTLFSLIVHTFNHALIKDGRSLLPPSDHARLQTPEQLGQEVGPDGFILIMLQNAFPPQEDTGTPTKHTEPEGFWSTNNQRVIGTASAKPYIDTKPNEPGDATHLLFKRPPPPPPASGVISSDATTPPQWEILAMAVDPALQGQGLASQLLDLTIEEIKKRERGEKEVVLLLSTMKAMNEGFYARRGWTASNTRVFPRGTSGSRDGFAVVEMYRLVRL